MPFFGSLRRCRSEIGTVLAVGGFREDPPRNVTPGIVTGRNLLPLLQFAGADSHVVIPDFVRRRHG